MWKHQATTLFDTKACPSHVLTTESATEESFGTSVSTASALRNNKGCMAWASRTSAQSSSLGSPSGTHADCPVRSPLISGDGAHRFAPRHLAQFTAVWEPGDARCGLDGQSAGRLTRARARRSRTALTCCHSEVRDAGTWAHASVVSPRTRASRRGRRPRLVIAPPLANHRRGSHIRRRATSTRASGPCRGRRVRASSPA